MSGVAAVVLAGGSGSRLGAGSKAAAPLAGRPLAAYPAEALGTVCERVAVVCKADTQLPDLPGTERWDEPDEPRHPLTGIVHALATADGPVLAAPGGWLDLPAVTVVLEDSATTPRARGRGIAPGAWTAIADSLRDEGLAHMITKVGVENEASRKAVAKSGFREIGVMRMVKRGPRKQTTVSGATPGLGTELAARLSG